MFNVVSLVIGAVALVMALVSLIPLLGWGNWFVVPVAAVGLLFGLVSRSSAGRTLNLVVLGIALVRLMIGGGLL